MVLSLLKLILCYLYVYELAAQKGKRKGNREVSTFLEKRKGNENPNTCQVNLTSKRNLRLPYYSCC